MRLTETNLSAFAAFLLTPHRQHGLSDAFLRAFLVEVAINTGQPDRFEDVLSAPLLSAEVGLEQRYDGPPSRTVDIDIQLMSGDGISQRKVHHLIIENKVKASAAQPSQLVEQFACVSKALRVETTCPITMVFLTPPGDSAALKTEYEALLLNGEAGHRKAWLRWGNGWPNEGKTVVDIVRSLLSREAMAEIEPITEYTRHTLKAFVLFLQGAMVTESDEKRRFPTQDAVDLIAKGIVELDGKSYLIARYTTGQVKVFDVDTDEEVYAYPKLRLANERYGLEIQLVSAGGSKINTQLLGRYVLAALVEKKIGVVG